MKYVIIILFLLSFITLPGQRTITDLNAHWQFKKSPINSIEAFSKVNLPHTYNDSDAFDDKPGYYRGKATYQKILDTKELDKDKIHYLRFEGVNQIARIWMNGQQVGEHIGGYTAFNLEVTSYLSYDKDTLLVEVDNSHHPDIIPLRGDFTFYGGIYRDVCLISVSSCHFSLDEYGSDGIFIKPLIIDKKNAYISASGYHKGFDSNLHMVELMISDQIGGPVLEVNTSKHLEGNWELKTTITSPHLWSIDDPYLYQFKFRIKEKASAYILDEIIIPYGWRDIEFKADSGFYLNGEYHKLIGVNRHQDRKGYGNALTDDLHVEDIQQIKDSGFNFLRTAHYPQDKSILASCDRLGIVASLEIPLDHEITDSPAFDKNCKKMVREMVYQYYNHPSIVIWAYMNEMGLGKHIKRDSLLMTRVADLARDLEKIIREADPYRYTMIPNHGIFDIYHKFGLTEIPMIIGWNLYYGWYESEFQGFGAFVDDAKKKVPDKPMIITEYGAGADPRITSFLPQRFDFSLDWTLDFHQSHLQQILQRNFIAGSAVWNMYDFGSESRADAVPHINNKGLCGYDRHPKPVFHLYRSHLLQERIAIIENLPAKVLLNHANTRTIPVSIISNQEKITLHTEKRVDTLHTSDYIGEYSWTLHLGKNELSLSNDDKATVYGYNASTYWEENSVLNINFGANFYYHPEDGSEEWIPDIEIPVDFMTNHSGHPFLPRNRGVGSDRPIQLTNHDPVYQTMINQVKSLIFYIPNGTYKVVMHLANLDDSTDHQIIFVNGHQIPIQQVNPFMAFTTSATVETDGSIKINFSSKQNNTYINGIQIIRL